MSVQDTVTVPKIVYGNKSGPASYATGGFELDLTADFRFIDFLTVEIETNGSLVPSRFRYTRNQDTAGAFAPGKAVIKIMREQYDKLTFGNVSGLPGGVTAQSVKFAAATTTGSGHTHSIDHDHPSATSGTPNAAGGSVGAAIGGAAHSEHTHTVDIASLTGTSGSQTHTHDRSFEYDHDHSLTETTTDTALAEVSATTNLSTSTLRYFAVGQ